VAWDVLFDNAFEAEFQAFEPDVQTELLAVAKLLVDAGESGELIIER
jgi:hypothetical protein